jgi:peptidoglycan hydrolase CwlO-like protein
MSAKKNALDDMKTGVPWNVLTKKHSKSSIYRAYEDYQIRIQDMISKTSAEVTRLRSEQTSLEAIVESTQRDCDALVSQKDSIQKEMGKMEAQTEKIANNLIASTEALNNKEARLGELVDRGVTDDLLDKLIEVQFQVPDELFCRMVTAVEYQSVCTELDTMRMELQGHGRQQESLQSLIKDAESKLLSKSNELAKARGAHHLILDAVEVTQEGLQSYSKGTLIQLFTILKKMEIRGEAQVTLEYMLECLEKVKEELELENSITKKRAELATIQSEIDKVTVSLRAIQEDIKRPIEEALVHALESINQVSRSAQVGITQTQRIGQASINSLLIDANKNLDSALSNGVSKLNQANNGFTHAINTGTHGLQVTLNRFEAQAGEWRRVRDEAAHLEYYLNQAILLFSVLEKKEAMLSLDPWMVLRLVRRIHDYVLVKLPGIKTKAPDHISQRELAISNLWEVSLSSVSEFLTLELDRQFGGVG